MPAAHRTRSPRRRDGFTLVELVLVVMLLGVMAGVAAPRYQQALDDAALRTAAKRLAADLRHARQQARTRAEPSGLVFSPADGRYQSQPYLQAVITDPDFPEQMLTVDLDTRVAIASADFGPSGQEVTFDFRGTPTDSGSVVLSNRTGSATVSVNALGEVTVSP